MTSIGSNIASSSGADSSGGPIAPPKVSLTLEEHLQNLTRMIYRWSDSDEFFYAPFPKSVAKVVEALRMDPCGDIDNLLSRIRGPLNKIFHGTTPLHWAGWMDDRVMVRNILSSKKVKINALTTFGSNTILFHAILGGNREIVEDLVKHKADVFIGGAFQLLVSQKDITFGILKTILTDNVNVSSEDNRTALHHAAKEGYTDVVKYILKEKANVNLKDRDGFTPLHYAAQKGSLEVVTLLLQQNADVNAVTRNGNTPLHFAARHEATNIVSLFVDHHAVIDALDKDGRSPLLHSLRWGRVNTSIVLIAPTIGADVHVKDKRDNNALHIAIQAHGSGSKHNMMGIVKLLRQHDVDANAKNSLGYSPFFATVVEGDTEVVKELLRSKEKIKLMEECNGQTVIQIAFDNGHEHIKRVLLEFDDVSRYVETLYRDRQVYVDAANAILVGAALIASVTFASWLQPPLGYTTYLDLAPSSPDINYVDVQHNASLRAFWIFNMLSFYFAIGTVVFGARSVLPRRQMFISDIVVKLRQNLLVTSILLACSVLCVIVAFGIAGCIVLTPILKFQWYMIVPTIFGGLGCLVSLGFLFKSMVEDNSEKTRKAFRLYD